MAEKEVDMVETTETKEVRILDIDDFIFGDADPGPSER